MTTKNPPRPAYPNIPGISKTRPNPKRMENCQRLASFQERGQKQRDPTTDQWLLLL